MKSLKCWAATVAMVALSGAAQAGLVDRGGGMIYDTTLNITWLADMNFARTSGHAGTDVSANGQMTWNAATAWASNLVYGGFSDWRLPTLNALDTTCSRFFGISGSFGFGCTGGELSHLFVTDLGIKAFESVLVQVDDTAEQIANLALFSNMQSEYLSSTLYVRSPGDFYYFSANTGRQDATFSATTQMFAVAVRPGDVVTSVPEPQTLALALLALGATIVVRKRQQC